MGVGMPVGPTIDHTRATRLTTSPGVDVSLSVAGCSLGRWDRYAFSRLLVEQLYSCKLQNGTPDVVDPRCLSLRRNGKSKSQSKTEWPDSVSAVRLQDASSKRVR